MYQEESFVLRKVLEFRLVDKGQELFQLSSPQKSESMNIHLLPCCTFSATKIYTRWIYSPGMLCALYFI
jgi:hypothetical protein